MVVSLSCLMAFGPLVSGCSDSDHDNVLVRDDGINLVLAPDTVAGAAAQLSGLLSVLDGGCLGLMANDEDYLVAWPRGTRVSLSGDVIVRLQGDLYAVGDEVEVSGVLIGPKDRADVASAPDECRAERLFVVAS